MGEGASGCCYLTSPPRHTDTFSLCKLYNVFVSSGGSVKWKTRLSYSMVILGCFWSATLYCRLKTRIFLPQLVQIWPFFCFKLPPVKSSNFATVNHQSATLMLHIWCTITLWFSPPFAAADRLKPFQGFSYPPTPTPPCEHTCTCCTG